MLVSYVVGNFLYAQVAVRQKVRCSLKSLFVYPFAHANTGLVLEQALEIRRAQVEFEGQITNGESGPRLNHPQDLSHTPLQHGGRQWVRRGGPRVAPAPQREKGGVGERGEIRGGRCI